MFARHGGKAFGCFLRPWPTRGVWLPCTESAVHQRRIRLDDSHFSYAATIHTISNRSFAKQSDQPLANEQLVAALIRKSGTLSADKLQVRILVDNDGNKEMKPKPVLMTLTDAISLSIEKDMDIIETALDQEVPVLRIDRLDSFFYKQAKKSGSKGNKKQPEKEFRFNAEIEENDLKRKVENIAELLEKGTTCIVSIRCKGWVLQKEPQATKMAAERVIHGLRGVAELMNEIRIFGNGTRAQFRLRPAK